uniref:SHSP domain-containing protein n=1 Tax=Vannella robusta TaxID=1487602 RepID=A0A6U1X594_9EUKA|mmetsp:Transcript_6191/g.7624  ORF Transcript_6191/g.7624 Transcript_6191/m.7624 type:complete len:244 (+) Transcript_6191:577-1308(+)
MLSFIRPTTISSSPFFNQRRNYAPAEGVPYFQENSTHWFLKMFLPDVNEEDFHVSVEDNQLLLTWKDHKKLKHQGRIYESTQEFEKSVEIPEGIEEDKIKVQWKEEIVIVSIPKPKQQLSLSSDHSTRPGNLMSFKVPENGEHSLDMKVEGNQLIVRFECTANIETGEGENKRVSKSRTSMQRRISLPNGVDGSDIDSKIENGELIVFLRNSAEALDQDHEEECKNEKPEEPLQDLPTEVDSA